MDTIKSICHFHPLPAILSWTFFLGPPAAAAGAKAALAGQTGKKRKAFGVRMVFGGPKNKGFTGFCKQQLRS